MSNKTIMNPNFAAATQLNPHATVSLSLPKGTKLIAIHDGEITFRSFLGAGGYTITISFDKNGSPLIVIGPHWPLYFFCCSIITTFFSLFFIYSFSIIT